MNKKYRVLSPDGFDTYFDVTTGKTKEFANEKEVQEEISRFVNNYKFQGYYSQTCYNGYIRRISLEELPDYCEIITIN